MLGKTIRLRAMEPTDADLMYVWENDPRTWESGDRKWPVSHTDIEALISHSDLDIWQTRQMRLMIETLEDHRTVGCIDLYEFDPLNLHASVGIFVETDSRRHGFAGEALELIENFARNTLQIVALNTLISEANTVSLRLFENKQYEAAGRLKKWLRDATGFHDQIILQKTL